MGLVVHEAPTEEPVSLAEAKANLRVDIPDDDARIEAMIRAARTWLEEVQGQQLVQATLRLYLDEFPCSRVSGGLIRLPKPPLISVSSVKYYDADETLQTLSASAYQHSTTRRPGWLLPANGRYWPSTQCRLDAVVIEYLAGYGEAADVPETYKQAIHLLVGHWYRNREAVLTGTISKPIELAVASLLGAEWTGSYPAEGVA